MTSKVKVMTPRRFVKLAETNKSSIKSVKIIPPKLGRKGFGKLAVEVDTPIYSQGQSQK